MDHLPTDLKALIESSYSLIGISKRPKCLTCVYVAYSARILAVSVSIGRVLLRIVQRDCLIEMIERSDIICFASIADAQGMMSFDD